MNIRSLQDSYRNARKASKTSGRGVAAQFLEALRLRFGPQRLGFDDYYLYRLYDPRYTFEQKTEFCGWRLAKTIDAALNQDAWRVYANDKVEFARAMNKAGLLTPKIVALYSEEGAQLEGSELLSNKQEAIEFLSNPGVYPVFLKPVHGTYGRGGYAAINLDVSSNLIHLGDGSLVSLATMADRFSEEWANGYIVQRMLTPHPDVEVVVGNRLSSLRLIVLLLEDGPSIFRAVWKLPVGNNMSDNFMHGKLGNLIAAVNLENGRIASALGSCDAEISVIPEHPDTGILLTDVEVPMWDQVKEYCIEAAKLFPGLAMQHWDIALTPHGPVALEVNVEGSVDLHQLAGSRGVYDGVLRSLVAAHSSSAASL